MSRLKISWIVIANIALMGAILAFVALYSSYERKENYRNQVEHFVNSTIAMEQVTGNYLEGEQGICDNWAQYINSRELTLEEAADFVRATHAKSDTSAHLIDTETLTGFSTQPVANSADNYEVSYKRMDLLGDGSWIADLGTAINITRTYTNPLTGEQSLAFCNRITVKDAETGEMKQAYLLRVVPISNLQEKWVFPQEAYENEDISIIDTESSYVIRGRSFKNASFFEFYKSYNQPGISVQQQLFEEILSETGSFTMLDSRGRECIAAHTPLEFDIGVFRRPVIFQFRLRLRPDDDVALPSYENGRWRNVSIKVTFHHLRLYTFENGDGTVGSSKIDSEIDCCTVHFICLSLRLLLVCGSWSPHDNLRLL